MATLQNGRDVPIGMAPGINFLDSLTTSSQQLQFAGDSAISPSQGALAQAGGGTVNAATYPKISYLWYLLGIFILLVVMKFAGAHEKSGMQVHLAGVGVWNFVVIGIMSMLFLVTTKTIVNKYPVKGLTDIVNMA